MTLPPYHRMTNRMPTAMRMIVVVQSSERKIRLSSRCAHCVAFTVRSTTYTVNIKAQNSTATARKVGVSTFAMGSGATVVS